MAQHRCTILIDGSVVATDVDCWIEKYEGGALYSWDGEMTLADPPMALGDWFTLELDDGRRGKAFGTYQDIPSGDEVHIRFQGSGPLEKPDV